MHNCTIIKSRNENSRQSSNRKTVPHKTGYQWLKNKKFYKPQYFYNQTKIFQQSSFKMLFQLWRNSAMVHKSQPRGKWGVISACYCAETFNSKLLVTCGAGFAAYTRLVYSPLQLHISKIRGIFFRGNRGHSHSHLRLFRRECHLCRLAGNTV